MPGSTLFSLCKKTQLCKFHQIGACTRGKECTFAHGSGELLDQPDLSSTKLCPTYVSSGSCHDKDCKFAHSKSQIRRLATAQTRKVSNTVSEPLVPDVSAPVAIIPQEGIMLEQTSFSRTVLRTKSLDEVTECSTQDVLTDSSSIKSLSFDDSMDGGCATRQTTCGGEVEPEGDNSKHDWDDAIKLRGRVVKNMFNKTRMCTFYAQGRCKKYSHCNFAHNPEELMPLPKLACTKLCPQLLSTGQCDKHGCTFAHCKEDLRPRQHAALKLMKRGLLDEEGGGCRARRPAGNMDPDLDSQLLWARHLSEDASALRMTGLVVRNTFIDVEDPELEKPRRRSHSAPSHLCRSLAEPGESGEAATHRVRRRQRSCQTWAATAARPGWDQQPCLALAHAAMPDTSGVPALALPCLR